MELKDVKSRINKPVYFDDGQINLRGESINEYIFSGCTLRKNSKGRFFYQAELKELKRNSVLIVPLEKVKVTKN